MKRIRSAWLALASACALTAVVGAARPHYGGTLRVEVADLSVARDRALPMVFETLTRVDVDRGPQPLLALSWESDARGLRWRIRLRQGIPMHDGSALASWQVATALRAVEKTWKIAADDDLVTIDLPAPAPDLAWTLATPSHSIETRTPSGGRNGTGPFRLERDSDERISLRAFDDYREGRPFVDAVEIRVRPLASQMADLESGQADFAPIQAIDARRVEQRGAWVAGSRPVSLIALVFGPHRSAESFAPLRRAVAAAVNRATVASALLQGRAEPATGVLPRWIPGYVPSPFQRKDVLARAAVRALPRDQRTLTLRVDPSDPAARAVADRVAADAHEWGFTLSVQAPTGLAPRPDARIVKLRLDLMTPERMLTAALATRELALPDTTIHGSETDVLDDAMVVPIVHLQDLYGVSDRIGFWNEPIVLGTGAWNFAAAWIRSAKP